MTMLGGEAGYIDCERLPSPCHAYARDFLHCRESSSSTCISARRPLRSPSLLLQE